MLISTFFFLSYYLLEFDEFIFYFQETYNSRLKEKYEDNPSTYLDINPDLWLEVAIVSHNNYTIFFQFYLQIFFFSITTFYDQINDQFVMFYQKKRKLKCKTRKNHMAKSNPHEKVLLAYLLSFSSFKVSSVFVVLILI